MADDLSADFAEFIKWRDAQRAAAAENDFEVPIFEKSPDGSERSVTLPFSQGKRILGSWWPDLFGETPEGGDGGQDGAKTGKAAGGIKDLFAGPKRPAAGGKAAG